MRKGIKDFGDGAGVAWFLFPATKTDDEIREQLEAEGLAFDGYTGHPGQSFARAACIRRTSTRVLVTQFGGLDI